MLTNGTESFNQSRLARPTCLEDMLLYRLNRVRAVGGGMMLRYCEGRFGVTRREWVMLALLSEQDILRPSELAERAGMTPSATSKAITTIVEKGLMERRSLPSDRRFAQLRLTEQGHKLYEQIVPLAKDVNRELLDRLTAEEIDALDSMLDRIEQQADMMQYKLKLLPRADRRGGGTRRVSPR